MHDLGHPEIKSLIREVLFDEVRGENLVWEVLAECLEELRKQYTEEADWYTRKELEGTFDDHNCKPDDLWSTVRDDILTYQFSTDHILHHVRDVLAGKPERVK